MKLDGNTFKRLQHIINELSAIDLTEDDLIKVTTAAIKAHRHRRKGTTFTEEQLKYQLRKLKTDDLVDELFRQIPLEEANLLAKGKEILGRTKLWFEEVPAKLKKGLNK